MRAMRASYGPEFHISDFLNLVVRQGTSAEQPVICEAFTRKLRARPQRGEGVSMIRRIGAGVLSLACFDHASRAWADPPPVAAVEKIASPAASWREGLSLQVGAIALGQANGDHPTAPIVGVRGAFRPNYRFTLLGGYDLTWHDQTVADLGATDRIHRLLRPRRGIRHVASGNSM